MDNLLKAASSADKGLWYARKLILECDGVATKEFATVKEATTFLNNESEAWAMLREKECKLYYDGTEEKVTLNKILEDGRHYQLHRYDDAIITYSLRYRLDIGAQYFKYFDSIPFRSLFAKAIRAAMDTKSVEYMYDKYKSSINDIFTVLDHAGYDTRDLEAEVLSVMGREECSDMDEAMDRLCRNITGYLSDNFCSYAYTTHVSYVVNEDNVEVSVRNTGYPDTSFSVKLYKKK